MRAALSAQTSVPSKSHALVLGARSVALKIASDLRDLGFQPEILETASDLGDPALRTLPSFSDPEALPKIREILRQFADRCRQSAKSPFAHIVHPGISPWAERAELAALCQELGLNIVSPPARSLGLFNNKLNLLSEAGRLGISNLIVKHDPISSLREIEGLIREQGGRLPLVLKSIRGGSSSTIFVLRHPEELEKKAPLWIEQLRKTHGEVILFAERYLEDARYVIQPFARMRGGRFQAFPLTDSSLQSRRRKILEFCPAEGVDAEIAARIQEWSAQLAEHLDFVGVGSFEFLVDGPRAFLVDGSSRLNTSYGAWESVAGTSAVAWQLAALSGMNARVPEMSAPRKDRSYAVSLRIYAEDSLLQLPQPGKIQEISQDRRWEFPGAQGVLNLGAEAPGEVGPEQDGLLGVLTVTAQDRKQALTATRGILDQIWIAGSLQTNERFLAELLGHPWVREGMFHASFIEEEFIPELRAPKELLSAMASVCATLTPESGRGSRWVVGDQWVRPGSADLSWLEGPRFWDSKSGRAEVGQGLSGRISLEDGRKLGVCAYPLAQDRWQVRLGNWVMTVRQVVGTAQSGKKRRNRLSSLVSGRIHAILYREDANVSAHDPLIIVDSLGTLVPHALPVAVRGLKWKVSAENSVEVGQELADFEIGHPQD